MRDFATYSEAKREGDKVVAGLAKGLPGMALTPGQANDALAALKALKGFYEFTGKWVSLREARLSSAPLRSSWKAAPWASAVDGFLNSVASVRRKDLGQAVEEFIESRRLKRVLRKPKCGTLISLGVL